MSSTQAAAAAALAGRVVLITGAAGGLGAAAAQACAQAGATVVLLGRKLRPLERVYDALARQGATPLLYPLDLAGATPDDYAALAQRLQSELGGLSGVLHCAAEFAGLTPAELAAPAEFARSIHVNLTARAWLTQACLPLLRQQQDAALVFVVDDPARVGQAYWGAYGAAQHAQRGLLASLHHETAAGPVRVSGLQPGPMRTALRARAFTHQEDSEAMDPTRYAAACVTLLSTAGDAHRGAIWSPSA
ncbi:SDR family NAD(P)-dependent oxidoreductase [Xanthomonas campestris pv. raphani]|uniref:SDR family NAD(P)-dependent oxidoreductase n=1 Tax=Xanthomonas campestris TaxID=339 RepID=UPI0023685F95|nr:SDR family NAD(P)-dependent oxidoreductase [Xanthomonas campestris]MEA9823663.1 SDR family NAD(P)-dependent oxidoreductase [Xanthomonas campestris pv. raphani]MEA9851377.1 SDR family NAD(P)-dependent oxidoreductase [Xanthomonas campestris pv. raphani]MEA9856135.1 SDR family NAD(P)-dependent oxidoreductase [Xanthomonas campestris pv. raphani]MEA9965076.1 SDR family NAD(P)-dependent oxidoreductase [Xanthomonas campestris pv. raphani]WDJ23900.1 SDR family NAD(P)-dependent oxidoreductase [Xanth